MAKGPIYDKSFSFSLRIIKLTRYLQDEKREYVLSKQLLRSGTAIGALAQEAEHAESKCDFIHKMSIALKEANESLYWLDLLHQSGSIDKQGYDSIGSDSDELVKLLVSIVKKSKQTLNK